MDVVLSQIKTPHWGSSQVWDDYASVGLYVYDWDVSKGVYRRVRSPDGIVGPALLALVGTPGIMFPIDCDFEAESDIRPELLR